MLIIIYRALLLDQVLKLYIKKFRKYDKSDVDTPGLVIKLIAENSYLSSKKFYRKLKLKAFAENINLTSMGQLRCILLILALFIGVTVNTYAQDDPPPPTEKRHTGPPCDPGDNDEGGTGVPPPVGLCLPIDDYVYILMAVGVMYGCYKLRNFEAV